MVFYGCFLDFAIDSTSFWFHSNARQEIVGKIGTIQPNLQPSRRRSPSGQLHQPHQQRASQPQKQHGSWGNILSQRMSILQCTRQDSGDLQKKLKDYVAFSWDHVSQIS